MGERGGGWYCIPKELWERQEEVLSREYENLQREERGEGTRREVLGMLTTMRILRGWAEESGPVEEGQSGDEKGGREGKREAGEAEGERGEERARVRRKGRGRKKEG